MGAWYDSRTKQEVMNLLILKQLQQAVGSFGLTGLDKLLSFMIVKELQVRKLLVYVIEFKRERLCKLHHIFKHEVMGSIPDGTQISLCVLTSALFCFRFQKFQGLVRGALKDKLVADTLVALSKQLTPVKSLIGLYFLCGTLILAR